MKMTITNADIIGFQSHLLDMERSPATIQKYLRDVTAFAIWLGDRPITKENTMAWKAQLVASSGDYGTPSGAAGIRCWRSGTRSP